MPPPSAFLLLAMHAARKRESWRTTRKGVTRYPRGTSRYAACSPPLRRANTDSVRRAQSTSADPRPVRSFFGPGRPPSEHPEIELARPRRPRRSSSSAAARRDRPRPERRRDQLRRRPRRHLNRIFPSRSTLGEGDFVNGRGQGGAGLPFLGPLTIYGGRNDELVGAPTRQARRRGNDIINGHGADLLGRRGNDFLTAARATTRSSAAPGRTHSGGTAPPTTRTTARPTSRSTAGRHRHATTTPASTRARSRSRTRSRIRPSASAAAPARRRCAYNAATKTVTASARRRGGDPRGRRRRDPLRRDADRLRGDDGEHRRDQVVAGRLAELVVDQRAAFAPGAAPTGLAEIEIGVNLGDLRPGRRQRQRADALAMGEGRLATTTPTSTSTSRPLPSDRASAAAAATSSAAGLRLGRSSRGACSRGRRRHVTGSDLADLIVGGRRDTVSAYGGNDAIRRGATTS